MSSDYFAHETAVIPFGYSYSEKQFEVVLYKQKLNVIENNI